MALRISSCEGGSVKLLVDRHLGEASDGFVVDLSWPVEHAVEVFRPSIQDQLLLCQQGSTISAEKGG